MTKGTEGKIGVLSLVLLFSVVQFYAQASFEKPISLVPENTTAASPVCALLSTTGNKNIRVDGKEVNTGATILDGAKLETGDCVGATVRWGSLNRVDLSTNTVASIHYGEGKLRVTLERGCARVKSREGLAVLIETPEVKAIAAQESVGSDRSSAELCYPVNNSQSYNPHCGAPVVWFFGGGGAVGTIAVTVALRGEAAGPSTPSLNE
jgi:hypothetical protein